MVARYTPDDSEYIDAELDYILMLIYAKSVTPLTYESYKALNLTK